MEVELGSVQWYVIDTDKRGMNFIINRLDIGKETISCYIETMDESQDNSALQLLSIRYAIY